MNLSTQRSLAGPLAALAMVFAGTAAAQSSSGSAMPQGPINTDRGAATAQPTPAATGQRRMYDASSGSFSVIPYATNGYIGLNVGRPDWDVPCGAGGFACRDSNTSYNIYTGGMFNPYFGAELGYVNFGRADRAGGRTRAHGLNISLIGQVPLGAVNLYAKVGSLYGRTDVSASPFSGLPSGEASGWEKSYGAGVGFNFTPQSAVVLEWNQYDLRFVGLGRQEITTTSLGYVHRF